MVKNISVLSGVDKKTPQAPITEREQCYPALFETRSMIGLVMYRPNGTLINCNQAFLNIIGYSEDDIESLDLPNIMPQKYGKFATDSLELLRQKGRYGPYKEKYIDKNGKAVPVQLNDVLIEGAGGQDYILSSVLDINRCPEEEKLQSWLSLISKSVDNAFNAFSITNHQGEFIYVNKSHVKLWGYDSVDEVIGMSPATHCADPSTAQQIIERTIEQGYCDIEFEAKRKDDSLFYALMHTTLGYDMEGREIYIGSCIDISARKQAEEELLKLKRAVECSSTGIIITDKWGTIEYVNRKFTRITGYEPSEALGAQANEILFSSKTARTKTHYNMWNTITSGKDWNGVLRHSRRDGSLYWAKNWISSVKDGEAAISHYITVHEDVSEYHELSEKLSYQASHDALTGLINRSEFERRVQRVISASQTPETQHALCYMDLDQFKVVNDTCGHIAGDELLRQIGAVLKRTVRKRDTIARLGGDEFGVLMEHCPPENARKVADSLIKAVRGFQFGWQDHTFKLGISIGLIFIDDSNTKSLTRILSDADLACYTAKDRGRNQVHVRREKDIGLYQRHSQMQWASRIDKGLNEGNFCLYAQPILSLNGLRKYHELLVRMLDEQGKVIPPGAFLPAAERHNLIVKLDRWIVQHAFALLAEHPLLIEASNFFAINLSAASLSEAATLELIVEWLDRYQLRGGDICFEITEAAVIANFEAATRFITTLKQRGCRFALDNFGAGLSSFTYLKNLPIDYLKIDGLFIRNIADDKVDYAMVKSINEIGQTMGMETIAEFVENESIRSRVEEIGIDYAQGYEIGKPHELMRLIKP